ncbi:MAG TPA: phosphoribosyltransferase family protein [Candidatus Acidoferrales bacterium]|nr:phosphoribosyltransferase family protein [Candidatus Acidoferrales bacterium]
MSRAKAASYSAARIASRVKALGRAISLAYRGRRVDIVVTMDRSFVFAADLVRAIDGPVAVHFVREDVRDVEMDGRARREVFFGNRATTSGGEEPSEFKGRDILLVDAVLDSGVTQEFLLRRIGENKPRSLRLAVLLDKASKRRVALEPDYFGFQTASNLMWSGYGLAGSNGLGRNGKSLVSGDRASGGSRRVKKRKR